MVGLLLAQLLFYGIQLSREPNSKHATNLFQTYSITH